MIRRKESKRLTIKVVPLLIAMNLILTPAGRAQNSKKGKVAPTPPAPDQVHIELDSLTTAAYAGDAKAQFALGLVYERGLGGIKIDQAFAMSWYEEAALNGLKAAEIKLATLLRESQQTEFELTK